MKRIAAIFAIVLMCAVPFLSDGTSGANSESLWLYEIMPAGSFEAVTLYNAGGVTLNLRNYYLDDGEGTVKFTADIFIMPKGFVTIASKTPEEWLTGRNVYVHGTYGIIAKQFILADAGDEVMLRRASDKQVIDAFVYGNGDTETPGWKGDAFPKISAGKMALRWSAFDTDTAADWKMSVAGRTEEKMASSGMFDAYVTPFAFPDSKGDPVFTALEGASREVLISMYLLDHKDIVSLLMLLLDKGVSVTILLEGSPVGGVPDTEIRYMSALREKGAEVNMIKSNGVYKRYDLVHNKYAVVDSAVVIVTSENWRESSFNGNRGWGAVMESDRLAEYMRYIFFADNDTSRIDIHDFKDIYPKAASISLPSYKHRPESGYETFTASVKPVFSPDLSFDYLKREMLSAAERIYSEQMSIQYAWTDATVESPLSWSLTASDSGVDVKILADVTFADADSGARDNYTAVSLINDMGIEARTIGGGENFGLTHNKGVIIDDTVWISSVNWTNAAFMNNREFAAVIYSKDVADFFAEYFISDWGPDIVVDIVVDVRGGTAGEAIVIDASSSVYPKGTVFEWDIGDGTVRKGVKIAALFPAGATECVLTVTIPSGSVYEHEFTVTVLPRDGSKEEAFLAPYVKYAPIFAILLIIFAAAVARGIRGKRDDRKGI
ncbi:MAG: phospholipase D-like domain-containing protein [Methanomassiliicoccaceae archaeon]|jgi:phosphatidylserine/phosphatidylglycerophosphate/cardiolipin synthase-like enzyme|nr:phospholipase D-like domain-containing protein [Methanomassiliicoccaceae archaeon]